MPSLKLYLQLYKTNSQKYPVSGPLDDSVRLTCLLKKLALKLARIEKSDFSLFTSRTVFLDLSSTPPRSDTCLLSKFSSRGQYSWMLL